MAWILQLEMSQDSHKQTTFKSVLIRQLFLAIGLSLLITLPIISIFAYSYFNSHIGEDIDNVETIAFEAINDHLSTGWQPDNLQLLENEISEKIPGAIITLQKVPLFLDADDPVIEPETPHQARMLSFIRQAESEEQTVKESNIRNNNICIATPIKFQTACLDCAGIPLGAGDLYRGDLIGTMLIQAPMNLEKSYASAAITFFTIFFLLFTIIAAYSTSQLVESNLLQPLIKLADRIRRLKISSTERKIDWQRSPHEMLEIDHIDEYITEHVDSIRGIYDKLDALMVTEHETGVFHQARFNEVMRYEVFRSYRYKRPFSLMVIKLVQVRVLNSTAKNIEEEEPGSKYMYFGNNLHNATRETDMSFRLDEHIFAVVAPETDDAGIHMVKDDIYRRLINNPLPEEANRNTALPEYEFTIQVGHSTYSCDHTSAKDVLQKAIEEMQRAPHQTGRYPPYKNKQN